MPAKARVPIPPDGQSGFTLIELITIMIVVGILAVVAMPHFANLNDFEAVGAADQLDSLIQYARETAVAQRRMVYLDFAANPPQLCASTPVPNCGPVANCSSTAAIALPGSYHQAKTTVTLSDNLATTGQICFDALGQPYDTSGLLAATKTVSIKDQTGGIIKTIAIENETGYVH